MGELLNRLSLYAAVDLAVQAGGRDVLERVAEVIPAYRNDLRRRDAAGAGDTARSADGRNDTAQKRRAVDRDGTRNITAEGWANDALVLIGREGDGWVDATQALDEMAGTTPPTAVDAGRRIKAIWMLIHAGIVADEASLPALERVVQAYPADRDVVDDVGRPRDPEQLDRSERSTVARADVAADDGDGPIDLFALLVDLDSAEEYRQRLEVDATRFISSAVVAAAATTCDDSTEYVTPGPGPDTDVAAVITTRITRPVGPGLTLETLRDRLHPDRWPVLLPSFWCAMVPCGDDLAPGVTATGFTRQEVVGDFGSRGPTWDPPTDAGGADALCPGADVWFRPILRFRHRVVPNGFELQFRLAEPGEFDSFLPNELFAQDDHFLVDAGAMSTRLHDGVVEVVTSKVLLMKGQISGVGLCILACAMGYGDMGAAMLEGALAS